MKGMVAMSTDECRVRLGAKAAAMIESYRIEEAARGHKVSMSEAATELVVEGIRLKRLSIFDSEMTDGLRYALQEFAALDRNIRLDEQDEMIAAIKEYTFESKAASFAVLLALGMNENDTMRLYERGQKLAAQI